MSLPEQCPLCAAKPDKQIVHSQHVYHGKPGQAVFICENCDLTYLHPILSTEEKDIFYAEEFPEFMAGRAANTGGAGWLDPADHIATNEMQRIRRMKYLEPQLPLLGGRILDVGCSSGFMLYPLAEMGYECVGIEPTDSSAEYIRSRGLTCFESLAALKQDKMAEDGFDLIMHFFVADQTTDTVEFIKEQIPLLKPGGKIIFEINSTNDPMISLYKFDAFDRFIWAVAQNYYFSQKSFRLMMERFGLAYEIILDQRYDLSNHMIWARDGKPGGMGRFTDELGEEVEQFYKQALINAGICDTLIGVLTNPR